jgi:hypothetical protein
LCIFGLSVGTEVPDSRLISPLSWANGILIEGSLEVKLPTIWTDGRAEVGRVREEKESGDRRSRCAKR